MSTQDNNTGGPPFHTIPHLSNLRDPALLPLPTGTGTGSFIRRGILFRSADPSQLDTAGWTALRELGVRRVFDLRSAPELAKSHVHNMTEKSQNADGDGEASAAASTSSSVETNGEGKSEETDAVDGKSKEGVSVAVVVGSNGNDAWPALQAASLSRSWVPVFRSDDYSPDRLAERYMCYMNEDSSGFVQAYEDILRNGGKAYGEILRYLAGKSTTPGQSSSSSSTPKAQDGENEKTPIGALIHCSAGKDRTGIFFGLLFDFLNVPRDIIAEEYNLTESGLAGIREKVVPRLMQSGAFKTYMAGLAAKQQALLAVDQQPPSSEQDGKTEREGEEDAKTEAEGKTVGEGEENAEMASYPPEVLEQGRKAALRMVGARKESMLGSLDMLDRVFGGAEAYMRRECGLGDEELEALRRDLVV